MKEWFELERGIEKSISLLTEILKNLERYRKDCDRITLWKGIAIFLLGFTLGVIGTLLLKAVIFP